MKFKIFRLGLFLGCFEIGRVYFPFRCCRCYLPLGYAHCNLIRCILSDMGEDKTNMDLVLESKNACGRTQVVGTLHQFLQKERDWGWKKFMKLYKVLDGFIDADTFIIKAQVQVIRERANRPFHCLDCQGRRELVLDI